jgi:transposase
MAGCPFCKSTHTVIKETRVKEINHCIKPQTKITILFHQKKFKCRDCGHSFMETNNIGSNISYYGKLQILYSLRNFRNTFSDVAIDSFTSTQSIINIFDECVNLSRHRLTKVLCFDEIYGKKLTKTKYSFCMFDPMSNTLLDILDARRKNVLEEYFVHIPLNERLNVNFVNIDMWQTYLDIATRYLPNATICVDSFHVIEHLNKAMKDIRIKTQKKFVNDKDSDRNGYYWLLKTFHYYFTENFDKIKYIRKPHSHYGYLADKYAVLNKLLSIDKDLTEAYKLKEEYREFNLTEEYSLESITKLEDFIERFKKSKFIEFIDFGLLLEHWKFYIVNSFIRVDGKRMSNGPMEPLNGRLKRLLNDGYGYTKFERFRNRALFSLNKDEPISLK